MQVCGNSAEQTFHALVSMPYVGSRVCRCMTLCPIFTVVGRCFSAHYADLRCISRNVRAELSRVFCRTSSIRPPCFYYFFPAVVAIRYETTATARWALLFVVRAFFNDTITVAVWTGFHVGASWACYHTPRDYTRWRFADPAIAAAFAREFGTTQTPSLRIKDA
jgi:hypothetical protein